MTRLAGPQHRIGSGGQEAQVRVGETALVLGEITTEPVGEEPDRVGVQLVDRWWLVTHRSRNSGIRSCTPPTSSVARSSVIDGIVTPPSARGSSLLRG